MYWQPRALPTTELEGAVVVDGPAAGSETEGVLHKLDLLALKYTSETLKCVSHLSEPQLHLTSSSSDRSLQTLPRSSLIVNAISSTGSRADEEVQRILYFRRGYLPCYEGEIQQSV